MLTMEQKEKYLEEDNEIFKQLCEDAGIEFIPHNLKDICWESVEERMNNPHEEIEDIDFDEEELFRQLDEDWEEMVRQGIIKPKNK